ncbi:Organic cation/carnitine transporter 3, partial [Linum grandiflorum]
NPPHPHMAPRHPLPDTSTTTPLLQSKRKPSKTLDAVIEHCIGDHFTLSQLLQSTLVSSAWIFDAQQTFISVFSDSTPTWHCLDDNNNNSCNATLSKSSKSTNPCLLPESTWAWDQYSTAFTSTVSEYNLACSSSPILKGLPASSFFIGCLVGGLALSTLADTRLGRKNALILSCLLMCSSSLLTALAVDVWSYAALRFLSGVGRATIGTCSLVLSTELVGRRWRGRVGIFGFLAFTVGFMSLPGIAYLNRGGSWRNLYVWTSMPVFVYSALVWLFVSESPRWLLIKGRKEEAVSVLASLAPPPPVRGTPTSFSEVVLETEYDNNDANVDIYSALKILVRKQWALRRLLSVMTLGVGIGLIYYGMPLALDNMDINLYLGVLLNALSELPSSLVNFLIIDRVNRKPSLLTFTCLSGACSVVAAASGTMGRWVQMGAEMLSFFGAITSFNILLIYTLELFPTCVRNSAVAMTRQALVLGGAFGPVVVALGRESGGALSYGVFGVVIGLCAVAVVPLPETLEKPLSDTMEEEEFKVKYGQFPASFV